MKRSRVFNRKNYALYSLSNQLSCSHDWIPPGKNHVLITQTYETTNELTKSPYKQCKH